MGVFFVLAQDMGQKNMERNGGVRKGAAGGKKFVKYPVNFDE